MILFMAYLIDFLASIFMLPLKDRRAQSHRFPTISLILVLTNVAIHVALTFWAIRRAGEQGASIGDTFYVIVYPFMTIAGLTAVGEGVGALSVLTSGFLHGSFLHLGGNMFLLWFFGRKLEDAMGPVRYLFFYLICLFSADFVSTLANISLSSYHSNIPGLGASGAILGLMAGYFFLYSEERIFTIVAPPIPFIGLPIPIPLWLPAWVFIIKQLFGDALHGQLIKELAAIGVDISFGVGVFAHLGGAVGGLLCVLLFLHPEVLARQR